MRLILFFLTVAFITFLAVFYSPNNKLSNTKFPVADKEEAIMAQLKNYAEEAKNYTRENHFNNRYCMLIDMKKTSGSKRFFIYDLKNDSILQAGLVTHGNGINNSGDSVSFSNMPGSNCTSLGKYKIGKSYIGKFGLAYKLYGLDKTNNNAFNRFVVLHAHQCVPDYEIAPHNICRSLGCPTISPAFLDQVKIYLDKSQSPMLLWIFN